MTIFKRTLLIGLIVIMIACLFAACAPSQGTAGVYTFKEATKKYQTKDEVPVEKIAALTEKETGLQLTIELKDGGAAIVTVNGKSATGTWTENGDIVTVTGEEVVYEFQHVDNTLVITEGDVTITLSK